MQRLHLTLKQNKNTNFTLSPARKITILSTTLALTPLVAFLFLILSPTLSSDITSATSSSSGLNIGISEVLSLSIEAYDESTSSYTNNSNLSMSIIPGTFKTAAARITADTNAPYGYHLVLSNNDSNNALVEQNDDPTTPTNPVISSIATDTTITDTTDSTKLFPDNTWGYNLSDTSSTPPTIPLTYSKIPTDSTSSTIANTTNLGTSTYTFTTGTRVDKVLPAGIYKDELVFSIIANAAPLAPSFYTTYYMQDFNQTACNSVKTPTSDIKEVTDKYGSNYHDNGTNATIVPSTTLIDKRDNQEYTIRKLADGNCWMTENLRYGSTPENTKRPYEFSDAYLSDNINTNKMELLTESYVSNDNDCGSYFTTSQYAQPSICIFQANIDADYDGKTKYGTLYNYCAATGGTVCNSSATFIDASGSVCPTNWKLPGMTSNPVGLEAITDSTVKTYDNVFNVYGVTNSSSGFDIVKTSPLNFVRAGYALGGSLSDRSSSGYGRYWSSTAAASANNAYYLYLSSDAVNRGYRVNRYIGFSVRCVLAS